MKSSSLPWPPPFFMSQSSSTKIQKSTNPNPQFPPISKPRFQFPLLSSESRTSISATLRNPKGFGPPKKKSRKRKNPKIESEDEDDEEIDDDYGRSEEGIIPEVVTNRMMKRMAFSVGIPLFTGLAFFPFFYYLKVGLKLEVPTWVPLIVSFFFFGSALLGVSYGIVSSSWDPLREGSFLGWTEAQKNWPVFWQSLRGGGSDKK